MLSGPGSRLWSFLNSGRPINTSITYCLSSGLGVTSSFPVPHGMTNKAVAMLFYPSREYTAGEASGSTCMCARSTPTAARHACIGAMLRILLHFFFASSFPTTPLMRLPIGSPALLTNTHALSSKRIELPSRRPTWYLVRTTTACRISPRLTLLPVEAAMPSAEAPRCSWTTTTIRSPISRARVSVCVRGSSIIGCVARTDRGVALLADYHGAFDEGGARVVNAIQYRLATAVSRLSFKIWDASERLPLIGSCRRWYQGGAPRRQAASRLEMLSKTVAG